MANSVDLRSIYIANGVGIFILLMLFYTSRTRSLRRNLEDRLFHFMVFGVMLSCVMEVLSYTLDGRVFPGAILINTIANTYLYTINLLLPFSVLAYVDLGLYGDPLRIRKHYKPQIVVGLVMFACNIVNLFVPITFYISEQNIYSRRPLSYVYYFVILYYSITSIVISSRYEKEHGARTFFNMKAFLLPILIGAGLQFCFYGLSLAWLSSAVGLTCLYMMQQNEMAYVDSLVDTYNRQYLSQITSGWISRGRSFAGVMVDVDHFKSINDRYGHSEGDRVLKSLTDILKRSRAENELVFRFAGDEFIILKLTDIPNDLDNYMLRVRKNLDEYNRNTGSYPLEISYGTSWFSSGDFDSFMKEMDDRMYEMKAQHHMREQ